jgi:hypothetical protein
VETRPHAQRSGGSDDATGDELHPPLRQVVCLCLSIIGGIALVLFYVLEAPQSIASGDTSPQVFGPPSDYAGLFQCLFMLPLTAAPHQLAPAHQRRLSLVAAVCGASGLLTAVIAQALLVVRVISFAVNLPIVLVALALIGTWMLLTSRLGGRNGTLPRWLARVGVVTGATFAMMSGLVFLLILVSVLAPAAATSAGIFVLQHPLLIGAIVAAAIPGFLTNFFGMLIWLIGAGRRLLAMAAVAQETIQPATDAV